MIISVTGVSHSQSRSMDVLVSRCQVLAGRFPDVAPVDLLDDIARVAADVPLDELAVAERMMAGMVLVRMLSHWAECSRLAMPAPITERLVALGPLPLAAILWRRQWIDLLDLCRHALSSRVELACKGNPRSAVLLEAIRMGFHESTLRLRDVAGAAGFSPWHAAHLLARDTGQGFIAHVRDHRVTAARQLLDETLLSVKEIAAQVGYSSARQLTRDFKRLCGTTPIAFRASRPS